MRKKSLIIGINNYKHFSILENCINDAEDIHGFLLANGFESTLLLDSTRDDLIEAIKQFKDSILEDTISLVFFSGHGLQDDKYNFLVAVDSEIRFKEDIKYNCILADDLLIENSKRNLHLIILDACRNNPFHNGTKGYSIGLLKMNAPAGTLIAFSTSPNSTSIERVGDRNGVYTKYLLKNMQIPNLPAEMVFKNTRNDVMKDTSEKQIPWEESSLFGDHFFFIEKENETIEKLITDHFLNNKSLLLPEVMAFLKIEIFENENVERLLLILIAIKIGFSNEEEGITTKTVDHDYLEDILLNKYYPLFEKRLINEDTTLAVFDMKILDGITIINDVNFGYDWLEEPDDSFSQLIMNYVEFNNEKGILCFYLFVEDNKHILKPVIITLKEDKIKLYSYAIIADEKVNELSDSYFKLRLPFKKEIPKWDNFLTSTTEEWTEEDFEDFLKPNE